MVRAYLGAYEKARGNVLRTDDLRYYEAERTFGFLREAAERILADAGRLPPTSKPSAFVEQRTLDGIRRRLTELTGVSVAPPAVD
jgi:hypothetical protein